MPRRESHDTAKLAYEFVVSRNKIFSAIQNHLTVYQGVAMTNAEIEEVILKGQHDGAKLYRVADWLYKIFIIFNWIIGIVGSILTVLALSKEDGKGIALGILLATAIICFAGYVSAVIGSNTLKVLVNILFSNLAILDRNRK
jgi:CHASE2 domain-containing sensor protein